MPTVDEIEPPLEDRNEDGKIDKVNDRVCAPGYQPMVGGESFQYDEETNEMVHEYWCCKLNEDVISGSVKSACLSFDVDSISYPLRNTDANRRRSLGTQTCS